MIEFSYSRDGELEVYENGEYIGGMVTMGDVLEETEDDEWQTKAQES
jgi:hypothetical protein